MNRDKQQKPVLPKVPLPEDFPPEIIVQLARTELDHFKLRIRESCWDFTTDLLRDQWFNYVNEWVHALHPHSERARARVFEQVADVIDESLPADQALRRHYKLFANKLRPKAVRESGQYAPWEDTDVLAQLTPLQVSMLNALWQLNPNQSAVWTVAIDSFSRLVWGDEEKKTGAIRMAFCRLSAALADQGVILEAVVHCTKTRNVIECKYLG